MAADRTDAARVPSDPFDPAYQWDDLDELVRNAQVRGQEVLMTIWGTPGWANGNKKPPFLPTSLANFTGFTQALASRYSGRYPGSRTSASTASGTSRTSDRSSAAVQLLGQDREPRELREAAAAGIAGMKAGNPSALVAIGETSSNGRDRKRVGLTDSVAPATFAKGVATANKRLKFDAWAQHPYPFPVSSKPDPEGALPERHASIVAAVRHGSRQVVRSQEHPDLDHRVRPRDEAG